VRRAMITRDHQKLSVRRQCQLLRLHRSSVYYQPAAALPEDLELMRLLDEEYTRHPFYGSRQLTRWLKEQGYEVNRKRVQRLMRLMGLEGIVPRPSTSRLHPGHKVYPYLLRGVEVTRANQVWAADITYLPMAHGFAYLVAIIDWYSRTVLAWRLSNTLDASFCVGALDEALRCWGTPDIFNTDQGAQFTAEDLTDVLKAHGVQISMDGKGRCRDNIFVERLWRTVKYEEVYLHAYQDLVEAREHLRRYFAFYNNERPHQAHGGLPPSAAYYSSLTDQLAVAEAA
jgi:putative transposase